MITLRKTKELIDGDPENWALHLMNFVDDFRRNRDRGALENPFDAGDERIAALLASTAETLCDEIKLDAPQWLSRVPAVSHPYFVSGIENLKAISLVESPIRFRLRKLFVLENFLTRV